MHTSREINPLSESDHTCSLKARIIFNSNLHLHQASSLAVYAPKKVCSQSSEWPCLENHCAESSEWPHRHHHCAVTPVATDIKASEEKKAPVTVWGTSLQLGHCPPSFHQSCVSLHRDQNY